MLKSIVKKFVGDSNERYVQSLQPIVDQINDLESEMEALDDEALRAKTEEFRQRLADEEGLEDLLPEAFAVVREASRRTIGLRHFDVQLVGGMVLHRGQVAEMKTGEGKTLVATLSLYLNALTGQGVHLITPNDYLSKVGVQWMGPIYDFLGLTSGVIQNIGNDPGMSSFVFDPEFPAQDDRYLHLRPVSRAETYRCDVVYGTNNEFGFDYLRDNMVWDLNQRVQRELYYAIVDEVDNILIDEARTPLIISGPAEEATDWYVKFADMVRRLHEGGDYAVDAKQRAVTATDAGIEKIEHMLGIDNMYSPEHYELTPYFENALKAQALFHLDQEYIVKDGEVIIVDEFTGRLMPGRRFSEGLHQAIEAKEGVRVQRESMTLATITFQNYFRMYDKLAGMTGTAMTEAEELHKIYKLDVTSIPTHRPVVRDDHADLVYKTKEAKWQAVVEEIRERHQAGQPVLVGTVSVEHSELLARRLDRRGVPHEVLNAKNHEREAEIIAQAGRPGAVTIATNMAGRGVDILLGGNAEGIARSELRKKGFDLNNVSALDWDDALTRLRSGEDPRGRYPTEWTEPLWHAWQQTQQEKAGILAGGGLFVLGTERHEARRIDNQLRGRAGRQGDPGESRFFVALEDDLMLRFGGERVKNLMTTLGVEDDMPIESGLVSKQIESAQVKVEGYNFDLRKHLLEYDEVINEQRRVIYEQRTEVLKREDLRPVIWDMVAQRAQELAATYTASPDRADWDMEALARAVTQDLCPLPADEDPEDWRGWSPAEVADNLLALAEEHYEAKAERLGPALMTHMERAVMLRSIDTWWIRHLTALDELRTGIGLRAIGQQDPLVTFKREGYGMFQSLLENVQAEIVRGAAYAEPAVGEPQRPRVMQRAQAGRGAALDAQEQAAARPEPVQTGIKMRRNDPCWCGSGKKYKQCHMKQDEAAGGPPPEVLARAARQSRAGRRAR